MVNSPFSRRTNWQQESNALNRAYEELVSQQVKVMDLTASNPTSCGFSYPEGMLSALSSIHNYDYKPDACGMSSAREEVAKFYARQNLLISSRDIILTASTSEA